MAGSLPSALAGPDTITFSRKPFMISLGVLLLAIIGLAVLWQSAGGDGDTGTVADDVSGVSTADSSSDDGSGISSDDSEASGANGDGSEGTSAADAARISDLESQVSDLETAIANTPAPALPASWLQRTIVSSDAQFVSATDVAVAVVGAFGGYANIDPATNVVTAAGQVSTEATRVLRTGNSVWITDFNGNQVLRINPRPIRSRRCSRSPGLTDYKSTVTLCSWLPMAEAT